MKDFGYYKNIINQKYNPEKKKLTKGNFYVLRNKIIAGDKDSVNELYELMCCDMYDLIAKAYVEKPFKVEFEDALQIAALMIYRMKIGDEKTRFRTNYFTEISFNTSLKRLEYEIMTKISKELRNLEAQEKTSQMEIAKDSQKINSFLQSPEELAIAQLNRETLKKLVVESGAGRNEELRKISGEQTWLWLSGEKTLQELSNQGKNVDGNRQTVHKRCKGTLENIANHKEENRIRELL